MPGDETVFRGARKLYDKSRADPRTVNADSEIDALRFAKALRPICDAILAFGYSRNLLKPNKERDFRSKHRDG
jgi:hypothetical protein